MDIFADQILSYKSIYLIALGAYLILSLTPIIYLISKRKFKPVYVGIPIALFVSFFHLFFSGLDWGIFNILKAVFLSILMYGAAFAPSRSIAGIVRSTKTQNERDLTFGADD